MKDDIDYPLHGKGEFTPISPNFLETLVRLKESLINYGAALKISVNRLNSIAQSDRAAYLNGKYIVISHDIADVKNQYGIEKFQFLEMDICVFVRVLYKHTIFVTYTISQNGEIFASYRPSVAWKIPKSFAAICPFNKDREPAVWKLIDAKKMLCDFDRMTMILA